jgi:hypothetical protein
MGGRLVFAREGSILLSIGEVHVSPLANALKFARAERAALRAALKHMPSAVHDCRRLLFFHDPIMSCFIKLSHGN